MSSDRKTFTKFQGKTGDRFVADMSVKQTPTQVSQVANLAFMNGRLKEVGAPFEFEQVAAALGMLKFH